MQLQLKYIALMLLEMPWQEHLNAPTVANNSPIEQAANVIFSKTAAYLLIFVDPARRRLWIILCSVLWLLPRTGLLYGPIPRCLRCWGKNVLFVASTILLRRGWLIIFNEFTNMPGIMRSPTWLHWHQQQPPLHVWPVGMMAKDHTPARCCANWQLWVSCTPRTFSLRTFYTCMTQRLLLWPLHSRELDRRIVVGRPQLQSSNRQEILLKAVHIVLTVGPLQQQCISWGGTLRSSPLPNQLVLMFPVHGLGSFNMQSWHQILRWWHFAKPAFFVESTKSAPELFCRISPMIMRRSLMLLAPNTPQSSPPWWKRPDVIVHANRLPMTIDA